MAETKHTHVLDRHPSATYLVADSSVGEIVSVGVKVTEAVNDGVADAADGDGDCEGDGDTVSEGAAPLPDADGEAAKLGVCDGVAAMLVVADPDAA